MQFFIILFVFWYRVSHVRVYLFIDTTFIWSAKRDQIATHSLEQWLTDSGLSYIAHAQPTIVLFRTSIKPTTAHSRESGSTKIAEDVRCIPVYSRRCHRLGRCHRTVFFPALPASWNARILSRFSFQLVWLNGFWRFAKKGEKPVLEKKKTRNMRSGFILVAVTDSRDRILMLRFWTRLAVGRPATDVKTTKKRFL